MAKPWIFNGAFSYAGNNYITWIRPTFVSENHIWNFEYKTQVATKEEIKQAMEENPSYITKL